MSGRLDKVVHIAYEAGRMVLAMQSDVKWEIKPDGSVVTQADLVAQRFIFDRLCKEFPDCGLMGEEAGGAKDYTGHESVFVVDPIDGTHSYQRGFPHYGVSIGLVENDRCTLGVFYNPALDKLYSIDRGEALKVNGVVSRKSLSPDDDDAKVLMVPSNFHLYFSSSFKGKVRNLGTTAEHLSVFATGQANAALIYSFHLWDVAAGFAMIDADENIICRDFQGESFDVRRYLNGEHVDTPYLCALKTEWDAIRKTLAVRNPTEIRVINRL